MRKAVVALVALGAMIFAANAFAGESIVAVTDPTSDGVFTGQYQTGTDENGDPTYGTQQGYVGVYDDGVVACNGNPDVTAPDPQGGDDMVLQGYIWVGSGEAASNPTGEDPSGNVGAGNNNEDADGNPTGDSPCPEADPSGVNE